MDNLIHVEKICMGDGFTGKACCIYLPLLLLMIHFPQKKKKNEQKVWKLSSISQDFQQPPAENLSLCKITSWYLVEEP